MYLQDLYYQISIIKEVAVIGREFSAYGMDYALVGLVNTDDSTELVLLEYDENRLLSNKHPVRQCLYDEIDKLRRLGWENENICNEVECLFKKVHYPKNYGMIDTCMLIRRHNDPYIIDLMEENIRLLDAYNITRHELIFNYVLWKQHKTISVVPFDNYRSKFFTQYPHYKHHYKVK